MIRGCDFIDTEDLWKDSPEVEETNEVKKRKSTHAKSKRLAAHIFRWSIVSCVL
jgi:hypothetical protein